MTKLGLVLVHLGISDEVGTYIFGDSGMSGAPSFLGAPVQCTVYMEKSEWEGSGDSGPLLGLKPDVLSFQNEVLRVSHVPKLFKTQELHCTQSALF